MTSLTIERPLPAAGGHDPGGQLLSELAARRLMFEAVRRGDTEARWMRNRIRCRLHRKVNDKTPGFLTNSRLTTPEGQLHLTRFVRRVQNGEPLSAGDVYLVPARLRRRIVAAVGRAHGDRCWRDFCYCDPPRETWFPEAVRNRLEEIRYTRALVARQGGGRKRARTAVVREVATCTLCGCTNEVRHVREGCPNCLAQQLIGHDSRTFRVWLCAFRPDGRPIGNPQVPTERSEYRLLTVTA